VTARAASHGTARWLACLLLTAPAATCWRHQTTTLRPFCFACRDGTILMPVPKHRRCLLSLVCCFRVFIGVVLFTAPWWRSSSGRDVVFCQPPRTAFSLFTFGWVVLGGGRARAGDLFTDANVFVAARGDIACRWQSDALDDCLPLIPACGLLRLKRTQLCWACKGGAAGAFL